MSTFTQMWVIDIQGERPCFPRCTPCQEPGSVLVLYRECLPDLNIGQKLKEVDASLKNDPDIEIDQNRKDSKTS